MLLPIHIAAGGVAIVLGAVALSAKKGGTIHSRSGLLFVYAMLIMGLSASILSLLKGRADGNVLAGVLTAYCRSEMMRADPTAVRGTSEVETS